MSFTVQPIVGGKWDLVVLDEPTYVHALKMAPEAMEPELNSRVWLVVTFLCGARRFATQSLRRSPVPKTTAASSSLPFGHSTPTTRFTSGGLSAQRPLPAKYL